MEKIIFRKFFLDLLSFFLIVSLSLSLITWIIQSVNYLDLVSNDGHGFKIYFSFVLLNFPKIFSKVIIFSYFVSIFFVLQKYQSNNEILMFWTNGISKLKFINFIIKISILVTIVQILITFFVIPKTQDDARNFIRTSNIDFFTSLISEKKFIDTVKDFTIFIEDIDEKGKFKNIFLKDSIDKSNIQIITARNGEIIENETDKFLNLNFGQILDISRDNIGDAKIIRFNNTLFNLSNFKTKSTTFPKIQELNSKILFTCVNNFLFGNKENYFLPIFHCSESSSIKSIKELFNRSIKQIYIVALGALACILIFFNEKNSNYLMYKIILFMIGILLIISSEINSELLNLSILKNLIVVLIPLVFLTIIYLKIFNLNKKNI